MKVSTNESAVIYDLDQWELWCISIAEKADTGLVWTDPQTDPYICGHRGHFQTSCGLTFSHVIQTFLSGGAYSGSGMGPGIM